MAAAGADALGLVFYAPSPRHVSIAQAQQIVAGLAPFITVVGLFVDASTQDIQDVLKSVRLDYLQFHGSETAEFCEQFARPYLKAIRVQSAADITDNVAQYRHARGILLDAYQPGVPGGTGKTFDWKQIPAQRDWPLILAGGLHAGNVAAAISQVRPLAVDVSGGVEAGKGIKDTLKINAFMHEVNRIDASN